MHFGRRSFIQRLALGLGIAGTGARASVPDPIQSRSETSVAEVRQPDFGDPPPLPQQKGYIRPGTIEVVHTNSDLVVVGGGIAGTCAAISAARNGVRVALVHERSTLGGNSSSEVRLYPEDTCGFSTWCRESGILDEIYVEERFRNWEPYIEGSMNSHWDLVLYEWAKREKNLALFLNTTMREVEMADESHILAVHGAQLGTEKEFIIAAPLFVDATGDGVLIYRSGAQFRVGKESHAEFGEALAPPEASNAVMGNTLFFRARDAGKPITFKRPEWAAEFPTEADLTDRGHGFFESGYWWIEVGFPMNWIRDNEAIRDEALRQLLGVWDHIKNRCTDDAIRSRARNYALEFIGFWPYKRESRRMLGDYILRERDVRDPVVRPDDIAYGAWGIDIHVPGGILKRHIPPYPPPRTDANFEERSTIPYGIPLRSCYSRNIENLLAAGRPISASYVGFASSRVLATGAIVGQGVGVAAALCKKYGCSPREVARSHAQELQQLLLRQDASIPGIENRDPQDLARQAEVTASSEAALAFPESDEFHAAEFPLAQLFPISSDRLESVELFLRSNAGQPAELRLGLRKAEHVWDFRAQHDIGSAAAVVPPHHEGYVRFAFNVRTQPNSLYYIYFHRADPRIAWALWSDPEGSPSQVPVGVTPADRPGKSRWRPLTGGKAFVMRVEPEQHPYGAQNIIRGTNRPDRWTNLFSSDPAQPLPAWVELRLPRPTNFNFVQVTFNNDINRRIKLPLFRYPECVKRYEIAARIGAGWKTVASADDNYFRRVFHRFEPVYSDRVRLTFHETNGSKAASVYEVRIYHEVGRSAG